MVTFPTKQIIDHLRVNDRVGEVNVKSVYEFIKGLSVEKLQAFTMASSLKPGYATVGPGDWLYIPAGWTFHESVAGLDVVGARITVLRLSDLEVLVFSLYFHQSEGVPSSVFFIII